MKKARQPHSALAHEALLAKSQLYARRALDAKHARNDSDFQLWAALALELLAKASLSAIHPSLVVETQNTNSLLEANGIPTGTAVRTITAYEAYARLKHTVPHFGTPAYEDCRKLADRRNAELHSGEAAFASFPPAAWEGQFWNAADLILVSMGMDLDEWLGVDSETPKEVLRTMRQAKRKAALERIAHSTTDFMQPFGGKKRTNKEVDALRAESTKIRPDDYINRFRYLLSNYWLAECPACKCQGVAAGDRTNEEVADDQSNTDFGHELVLVTYEPVEFHCPTCQLGLEGREALDAGGIGEDHYEEEEREIEFEPEYGND